jgi:hypothetical protein
MALNTYTALKAAVADWLMRDDLTSNIPDFITLCESRNNLRIRTREMHTTTTLTDAGDYFVLPTDFIEPRRVLSNVDPVCALEPITDDLSATYPTSGYPYYYVIKGSNLYVYPPSTEDITLDYWAKIPALSDSNASNWLLLKAPAVYLYGALMESAPFLEDDARTDVWAQLYVAAIDELTKAEHRTFLSKAVARRRGYTP